MNHDQLAEALLAAVRAQDFAATPDRLRGGAPVEAHPSIDLAVARFAPGTAPIWANVLFSREHPEGFAATVPADAGAVADVSFLADQLDAQLVSPVWQPGADWTRIAFQPLFGQGPRRVVAPYPGSLVKMMVLVGVARAVDAGRTRWDRPLGESGETRPAGDWAFDMTALSCNRSTDVLVAHLHEIGVLDDETQGPHELHRLFANLGLPGLRIARTRADGGWRNVSGAGVGQLQMTAWDALRLFWLIDPDAPPAPWLPDTQAPLLGASLAHVMHCLRHQRLHHVLSSSALRHLPDWRPGIPDADGCFAHKTGNTENYTSNAGIVRIAGARARHYLVALTSNLGNRYAPHPEAVTTWKVPALGAAIDALLQ
ncbi:MAG: hypothetical protein JO224_01780 [Pelomonas sp.]|nr:hypothetical protein [Roseateles sp.]